MVSQNYHQRRPSAPSDLLLSSAPPPAPSVPPAPRASSVTSGRSHTRRHRHARTHHGGSSSHLPQNEFPVFSHTGDVEIVISNESGREKNRYVLHRLILSQCSGYFEAGTRWTEQRGVDSGVGVGLARISENGSVAAGSDSRASSQERRSSLEQAGKKRWNYVLDWEGTDDDEPPMLVQRDSGPASLFGGGDGYAHNKPPTSSDSFFRGKTNFSALSITERSQASAPTEPGDEVLKDYDNLFRTMYQHPPILDTLNIANAYTECKALLHLADMYDALEIVGTRVDHHLLRYGNRLFKQIAKYPPSYLKLGYLARSKSIFTESLIHVVGQWPLAAPQLRQQIDAEVLDLIEDKADELDEQNQRVEAKLWRISLTTNRGERVNPGNDFLGWLAMSLFRQWVAENTTPALTGILKDSSSSSRSTAAPAPSAAGAPSSTASGGNHIASQRTTAPPPPAPAPVPSGRIYRLIGSTSPSAYLAHDELKRFLKLQPELYTRDNLRRFERKIDEMKRLAREVVRPLMRSFLELDTGEVSLGYLTCTRVEAADIPWDE